MKALPLSDEERRDLLKFVAFVVIVAAIVVLVWIVNGTWADDQWVAIGAAAALVQAVAVSLGVLYAAGQIRVTRQEGDRRRRHELLDRLDTVLPELEAAARRASTSWELAVWIWDRYVEEVRPETPVLRSRIEKTFNEQMAEYDAARVSLQVEVARVSRTFRSLGFQDSRDLLLLNARTSISPTPEQFRWVEERGSFHAHDFERLHAAIKRVLKETEQMTDQYAPKSS